MDTSLHTDNMTRLCRPVPSFGSVTPVDVGNVDAGLLG
jgi:hypothetical protein